MKYIFFILILTVQTSICIAKDVTPIEHKILELGFNFEFQEAELLINEQFRQNPDALKNHYLYINTKLLEVTKARDAALFKFKNAIKDSLHNLLIEYAEKVVEENEDKELSLDDQFYLGSIYGLLGRIYAQERSWMSAFSNGKTGRNIMQEIIEKDPHYADAYLLLGSMNYYADRLGGIVGFVAGILGLSGDRDVGIQYLKIAEEKGNLTSSQAAMLLMELYSRLENNKFDAIPYFEKVCNKYPRNSHFINWYCRELMSIDMLDRVDEFINSDSLNLVNDEIKARYYHSIGEYDLSNKILDSLLADEDILYPWVNEQFKFLRVQNYLLLGNMKESDKFKNELNEDRQCELDLISNKLELTKWIFNFRELVSMNMDKKAIESLTTNPPDFNGSIYNEGLYLHYLGVYNFKNKSFTEAEKYFIQAMGIYPDGLNFISSRYLVQIYKLVDAEVENIEKFLDDIEDFDDERWEFVILDLERKYDL